MRYANNKFGSSTIGVEPQPREAKEIASVEITDYYDINIITITDKEQLQEVVNLLRDASEINGWGAIK